MDIISHTTTISHHGSSRILSAASSGNGRATYLLHEDGHVSKVKFSAKLRFVSMERLPVPSRGWLPRAGSYLVESDGEILLVREVLGPAGRFCNQPGILGDDVGFEVCRLDEAERRWARVERLAGDRALFVSWESAFSVRASETAGCLSGCVYFISEVPHRIFYDDDADGAPSTSWGAYSVEDGRILFQRPVVGESVMGRTTVARWFLPNVR